MIVNNNVELSETIDRLVTDSGMKKRYISSQLGIPNQNFKRVVYKKNITLDETNKILRLIGYEAKIVIEKSQSKKTWKNTQKMLDIPKKLWYYIITTRENKKKSS